nr:DUF3164 family protein [uncultured Comamonas sp.]
MKANTIPEGYREDARGSLIPLAMIKPIDLARDELVSELATMALAQSASLLALKKRVFSDIRAFVELSAEKYDAKLGGKKGNLTLYTFDGKYKVQVAISERMVFDERLQAAKALIDECITAWSEGSRDEIKVLVQSAFQTDQEGRINTGRVLSLRRMEIRDEKWLKAMAAIGESLQVVGSKEYVRFYVRVSEDKYEPISLDLAAV